MSTLTPEVDIATVLHTAIPALVVGTSIKYGPPRSPTEPGNDAVKIWISPYIETGDPLTNAAVEGALYETRVQLTVLSPPDDYATGLVLARQVRDAITFHASAGYAGWYLLNGPNLVAPNEAMQQRWTVNIKAVWKAVP